MAFSFEHPDLGRSTITANVFGRHGGVLMVSSSDLPCEIVLMVLVFVPLPTRSPFLKNNWAEYAI